jgi:hypothetical protein
MKVQVPGGYGEYRVGALGKLIGLEKDPTLLKRAFTYNSSSFVPYYFYPTQSSIYYSPGEEGIHIPTLKDILSSQTNASLLDKLFIYSKFAAVSRNDFIAIDITKYSEKVGEDQIFSSQDFKKKFIGYFYNKTYRTERRTVQIIYSKDYNTAAGIGNMLEGNGIRVVDISQRDTKNKYCVISEEQNENSITVRDLSRFFGCENKKESSSLSDIVLTLGSLESEWELDL